MNSRIIKNQENLSQLKEYGLNPKEWDLTNRESSSHEILFKNKKSPWMSLKAHLKEEKFINLELKVAL